ncbi:MAG TPA: hypothetical protein VFH31_18900 [Pyrinomonadaceae bacterium]|nr:hypothetical protein [Pyrinomonadaceae bacterium]
MNRKKIFVGLLGAVLVALFASTSVKAQAGFKFEGDAPNVQAAADGKFTMTFTVKNLSSTTNSVLASTGPSACVNVTDPAIVGDSNVPVDGGDTQSFEVSGTLTDLTKDGKVTLTIVYQKDGKAFERRQTGTVKKPDKRPQRNR